MIDGVIDDPHSQYVKMRNFSLVTAAHTVLAVPGITKTPMLKKTTSGGIESLNQMPAAGRERYRDVLDHYATMSANSHNARFLVSAEQVAVKLHRIVDRPRPRFKYHLAPDAWLVDRLVTRLLPWRLRAAVNARAYRLSAHPR